MCIICLVAKVTPYWAKQSQTISPLVQSVISHLEEKIDAGRLTPGSSLPSERELAQGLKVSRAIVRSAIQELGQRGHLIIKENCRPVVAHRKGAVSRAKADHIAAWIWPRSSHFAASQILKGIQSSMGQSSLRIVVGHAGGVSWQDIVASEAEFLQNLIDDEQCAGAIVWYIGGEANEATLAKVIKSGVPLVFVDRLPEPALYCDYTGTDNPGASFSAVNHLIELGHRRIACMTNLDQASSVKERITGWRQAHDHARLPLDEALIISPDDGSQDAPEECYVAEQVEKMLSLPDPPTAVFCINDSLAINVMESLASHGKRVPEDISVVGFDGLMSWMPNGGGLTSAFQDFERFGQTAVRLLKDRIANPTLPSRHVLLDAPLRLNGSTAQAARRPDPALLGQTPNKQ